jgi:hypothetical protein
MPSRHYRRAQRVLQRSQQYILKSTKYFLSTPLILEKTKSFNEQVELYICDIIESITNKIELDKVIEDIVNIKNMIKTREDAYKLLETIENTVLSIVDNVISGTDMNIIICRIQYLKKLVDDAPAFSSIDCEILNMIENVIVMITDKISLDAVIENMTLIHNELFNDVVCADGIIEIQNFIMSIIDNISSGTDMNIITCRLQYLQNMIHNLPEKIETKIKQNISYPINST